MALTDEALAERCLAGNRRAFDELVQRYHRRVYGLCRRMLGEDEEAADVAQEVFVRAYRHLDQFDPSRRFKPWLMTIATNLSVNRLKGRRPEAESLDQPAGDEQRGPREAAEPGAGPAQTVEAGEFRERLETAIRELPDQYRIVALLRYGEGLAYEEIAAATRLPLGTVKTHLFRAKQKLREKLADYVH
jgi:RNA polymerase sigma-70 factor (ECF subfamily)